MRMAYFDNAYLHRQGHRNHVRPISTFHSQIASIYLVASARSCGYQCDVHNFVDNRKIIDVDASVH